MRLTSWAWRAAAVAAMCFSALPAVVRAQAPTLSPTAQTLPPGFVRLPKLTIGVGIGRSVHASRSGIPIETASVEYRLTHHVSVLAELSDASAWKTRFTSGDFFNGPLGLPGYSGDKTAIEGQRAMVGGGSIVYRFRPERRASLFVGAGGTVATHQTRTSVLRVDGCFHQVTTAVCIKGYTQTIRPSAEAAFLGLAGADVRIAGPVSVYADVRVSSMGLFNAQASTGIRLVVRNGTFSTVPRVRTVRLEPSMGVRVEPDMTPAKPNLTPVKPNVKQMDVRVTTTDGARSTGRLISLSETQIVIDHRGASTVIPLSGVMRVEQTTHHARFGALVGLSGGLLFTGMTCSGGCVDDGFNMSGSIMLMFGGAGAAIGGAIGAAMDATSKNVLYQTGPMPAVTVSPIISKGRVGASLAMQW